MYPEGIQVSRVFADPRGKFTHGGEHREHMFVVYLPGSTAHHIRRNSEQEAEEARGEFLQRLDEQQGTVEKTPAKPKVRAKNKEPF